MSGSAATPTTTSSPTSDADLEDRRAYIHQNPGFASPAEDYPRFLHLRLRNGTTHLKRTGELDMPSIPTAVKLAV